MPFYEYQCQNCERKVEALQKISDAPLLYCPECNQPSLKKLISAAAFHLKGTGWYQTDFKNNDKQGDPADSKSTTDAPPDSPSDSDKAKPAENADIAKSSSNPDRNAKSADKDSHSKTIRSGNADS